MKRLATLAGVMGLGISPAAHAAPVTNTDLTRCANLIYTHAMTLRNVKAPQPEQADAEEQAAYMLLATAAEAQGLDATIDQFTQFQKRYYDSKTQKTLQTISEKDMASCSQVTAQHAAGKGVTAQNPLVERLIGCSLLYTYESIGAEQSKDAYAEELYDYTAGRAQAAAASLIGNDATIARGKAMKGPYEKAFTQPGGDTFIKEHEDACQRIQPLIISSYEVQHVNSGQ